MSRSSEQKRRIDNSEVKVLQDDVLTKLNENTESLLRSMGEPADQTPKDVHNLLSHIAVKYIQNIIMDASDLANDSQINSNHIRFLVRSNADMVRECDETMNGDSHGGNIRQR